VIASIVLHGLTASPLTDRYTRWLGRHPPTGGIEGAATKLPVPVARRWPRHTPTLRRRSL
jgi:hypothetical protein